MKKLPNAQRRVLHRVAKANNEGFLWWKCACLHDMEIFRKLVRRGYAAQELDQDGRVWVWKEFLTPKGWAASGIKQKTEVRRSHLSSIHPLHIRSSNSESDEEPTKSAAPRIA